MTEGAGEVFVIFDPDQTLDAMQAALFARPHVTLLRCPLMGARLDAALVEMNVLPQLIDAAGEGKLSAGAFCARLSQPPAPRSLSAYASRAPRQSPAARGWRRMLAAT